MIGFPVATSRPLASLPGFSPGSECGQILLSHAFDAFDCPDRFPSLHCRSLSWWTSGGGSLCYWSIRDFCCSHVLPAGGLFLLVLPSSLVFHHLCACHYCASDSRHIPPSGSTFNLRSSVLHPPEANILLATCRSHGFCHRADCIELNSKSHE
jgi:hypothetical protein